MYDETGLGWLPHMLHGTSKILQLVGPDHFRIGAARGFFLELRIFEAVRTIVFNETSFLTQQPWTDLLGDMWNSDHDLEWHPKEGLLDIMVLVSDLCAR